MRTIAIAILLLIPMSVLADDVSKTAKVEQLIQLSNTEQNMKAVFEQMKNMQIAQIRGKADITPRDKAAVEELQTRMMDLMAARMTFEKVRPTMVKAYADVFTEEEIDGIVAFYQSPAGKAMLQKSPQLMVHIMSAAQQQMGDLAEEIKKITDEVKAKYQAK